MVFVIYLNVYYDAESLYFVRCLFVKKSMLFLLISIYLIQGTVFIGGSNTKPSAYYLLIPLFFAFVSVVLVFINIISPLLNAKDVE